MLGLSVIILFKSLLHVFCSLVFSAHNSSEWQGVYLYKNTKRQIYAKPNANIQMSNHLFEEKNEKQFPKKSP